MVSFAGPALAHVCVWFCLNMCARERERRERERADASLCTPPYPPLPFFLPSSLPQVRPALCRPLPSFPLTKDVLYARHVWDFSGIIHGFPGKAWEPWISQEFLGWPKRIYRISRPLDDPRVSWNLKDFMEAHAACTFCMAVVLPVGPVQNATTSLSSSSS